MAEEVNLGEAFDKPLSDGIINQMAEADEERKDLIAFLPNVSANQANLIGRMFKTLKVDAIFVQAEENAEDSSDVSS